MRRILRGVPNRVSTAARGGAARSAGARMTGGSLGMPAAFRGWAVLLLALAVSACSVEPQPIQLGAEECSHCRMVIGEQRFTAQALNRQGRAFSFDAIECMADWAAAGEAVTADDLHSLWVADFAAPHGWIRADEATFLRSDEVRSPMGAGLTAHASAEGARSYQAELGGELLGWDEVVELVSRQGGHGHHHAHAH